MESGWRYKSPESETKDFITLVPSSCWPSCLVTSDSLWPHGLQLARILCPWGSPRKNSGVGCHFLLQRIFPTQELNRQLLHLLHCRWILYQWATGEAPLWPHTYTRKLLAVDLKLKFNWGDLHDSSVVKTVLPGLIPGQGTNILSTLWHGQIKLKRIKTLSPKN